MRRTESSFASPAVQSSARHLAMLVRQGRLARRWSRAELAERARVSVETLKRMEAGSVSTSLGIWLSVLERLGLLPRIAAISDPASQALLDETRAKRARRKPAADDLDF